MQVQILGPLQVIDDGHEVDMGAASLRRLLARLAVASPAVVPGERLAEELGLSPGGLRTALSRLRKSLGDHLVTEPPGYKITAEVDAKQFGALIAQALEAEPIERIALCDQALDLWRGAPIPEVSDEDWARTETARLEELHALAREARVQAKLDLGRHAETVSELETIIADFPYRDEPRRQLMTALAESGRRTEALRAFQDYRRLLNDEVGTEPGQALWELDTQIAAAPSPPDGPAPDRPAGNLPGHRGSFLGRDSEVEALAQLLGTERLVTLTGTGGVGKTSLAIELARVVRDRFPDGAWWCELAPLDDPNLLITLFRSSLGIDGHPGDPTETVVEFLSPRQSLLVLDNCEHLLDAVSELTDHLLDRCPDLVVLATSREGLGLPMETQRTVASLVVGEDASNSPAVDLFISRALQAGIERDLPPDDVLELCRRLDGIPLAIELAAGRARMLSPSEMNDRMDERFRLLTGRTRGGLRRHQTLRATLDWSYDLLEQPEAEILNRLSVFAGGWTLEAAEQVTPGGGVAKSDVFELLASLADKSLIRSNDGTSGTRFSMLETVRDYARERLFDAAEADSVHRHHADWAASLTESLAQQFNGPEQVEANARMRTELDNIRVAVAWYADAGETRLALRILRPLAWCHPIFIPAALLPLGSVALQSPDALDFEDASAALILSYFDDYLIGDLSACASTAEALAELSSTKAAVLEDPIVAYCLGVQRFFDQDADGMTTFMRMGASRASERGDDYGYAVNIIALAGCGEILGLAPMVEETRAAYEITSGTGNPSMQANAAMALGRQLHDVDPESAAELYDEAIDVRLGLGTADIITCNSLVRGGLLAIRKGDVDGALDRYSRSIVLMDEIGASPEVQMTCLYLAHTLSLLGDNRQALELSAGTEANASVHFQLPQHLELRNEIYANAESACSPGEISDALEGGRGATPEEVRDRSLAIIDELRSTP